jgi:hypothetical protein
MSSNTKTKAPLVRQDATIKTIKKKPSRFTPKQKKMGLGIILLIVFIVFIVLVSTAVPLVVLMTGDDNGEAILVQDSEMEDEYFVLQTMAVPVNDMKTIVSTTNALSAADKTATIKMFHNLRTAVASGANSNIDLKFDKAPTKLSFKSQIYSDGTIAHGAANNIKLDDDKKPYLLREAVFPTEDIGTGTGTADADGYLFELRTGNSEVVISSAPTDIDDPTVEPSSISDAYDVDNAVAYDAKTNYVFQTEVWNTRKVDLSLVTGGTELTDFSWTKAHVRFSLPAGSSFLRLEVKANLGDLDGDGLIHEILASSAIHFKGASLPTGSETSPVSRLFESVPKTMHFVHRVHDKGSIYRRSTYIEDEGVTGFQGILTVLPHIVV